jgi:2,4-dienoyl-CoA reductase-like NADH-dependent reductase (Old Yellow Enzyme family)
MMSSQVGAELPREVELGSPLVLRSGQVLKNRIAKSAMSERLAVPGGQPGSAHVELYRRWAAGGAGLLVTGNVMVDRRAIAERGNVVLEHPAALAPFRTWAKAASESGSAAWMQINHPGRQVPRLLARRPVAPSAVALTGTGGLFARPLALEATQIEELVERFAQTAALAKAAGFSGVQIHAAHGYLISQFLSPLTNLRSDAWGGDPDRRRRFLLAIVRAVRAAVGDRFSLGVKLNSADFQRGGFDREESMRVIEALDAEGIDLLEISGGTYESAVMFEETVPQHGSSRAREAFFLEYAESVRARARMPLMVTGGFRTRAGMLAALQSGASDVIGMARPLALEPALPAGLLDRSRDAARSVRLATGIRKLDVLVQGAFYGAQLQRLAHGLPPAADLSRWRAVYAYVAG